MSLTIGLVNHNYGRYLKEAIDAALSEADEVIVSDDASTDESLSILESYGERIRVFAHDENDGRFMRGANEIIDNASCEWLAWLSSDDKVMPGFGSLPREDSDWVYCDLYLWDGFAFTGMWQYAGWPTEWRSGLLRAAQTLSVGVPHIGVQRTSWIRDNGLRFSQLESTQVGDDAFTVSNWLLAKPRIHHDPRPLLAYRQHADSLLATRADERGIFRRDFAEHLRGIS